MNYNYKFFWKTGKESSFNGGAVRKTKRAYHIDSEGCTIIVPWVWITGSDQTKLVD